MVSGGRQVKGLVARGPTLTWGSTATGSSPLCCLELQYPTPACTGQVDIQQCGIISVELSVFQSLAHLSEHNLREEQASKRRHVDT